MDNEKSMEVMVPFTKITKISSQNQEFSRVKIWAIASGTNRNYSYISKEELDAAVPSLNYLPIVGHLIEEVDADGCVVGYRFGGHDCIVSDDLEVKMITVPYGVVIANTANYEIVTEYGEDVEYLTVEAFLWTGRWPELRDAIASDEIWFNQSAEIKFKQWRPWSENSLYTELLDISFSALCILGRSDDEDKNVEPCFISARIEPITEASFSAAGTKFDQLMGEMREQLALCFDASHQKGGKVLTQEVINEIFARFELTQEEVSFEITEDMTTEQLTAALEEFVASKATTEPEVKPEAEPTNTSGDGAEFSETEPVGEQTEPTLFSVTYREKEEFLRELCCGLNHVERDDDGNVIHELYCYLVDFDDSVVYVRMNNYTPEKYDSKTCRYSYNMSETGEAQFVGEPEEVFQKWLTAAEIAKLDEDRKTLENLQQFKDKTERNAYEAKVEELANAFDDVSSLEEFSAIKEQALSANNDGLEMMETKLFALRGKQVKIEKPSAQFAVRVGIDLDERSDDDDGYGGLIYRARRRNRR